MYSLLISSFIFVGAVLSSAIPTSTEDLVPRACTTNSSPAIARVEEARPVESYLPGFIVAQDAGGVNRKDAFAEFTVPDGAYGCQLEAVFPIGYTIQSLGNPQVYVYSTDGPLSYTPRGIDVSWAYSPKPVSQVGTVVFSSVYDPFKQSKYDPVKVVINSVVCKPKLTFRFRIASDQTAASSVSFEQTTKAGLSKMDSSDQQANNMVPVDEMDQFTLIDPPRTSSASPNVYADFNAHTHGQRVSTDAVMAASIRKHHPDLGLTVTPAASCDLLAFATAGNATAEEDTLLSLPSLTWRQFRAPPRRDTYGAVESKVSFARYRYKWKMSQYSNAEFLLYVVEGTQQDSRFPVTMLYILSDRTNAWYVDSLIRAASIWVLELHDEILVYDNYWTKNKGLYESVQNASWDDVILDEDMKRALIADVEGFFNERSAYLSFNIPWKRGVVLHGPPGNGKTISTKAIMHSLSGRSQGSIPTLYVRAFIYTYQVHEVFAKARAQAPCLLIFEDIDTLVKPQLRSYFFNEVDGLESNDGIMMLATTNHLDQLDPGLAKRPSRFDRKYLFPNPSQDERTQYCEYWRKKLIDNQDIMFPARLSPAIAAITYDFSFAYIKEAFVASLMFVFTNRSVPPAKSSSDLESVSKSTTPAATPCNSCGSSKATTPPSTGGGGDGDDDDDDLDKVLLWGVMKKQVAILREEMDSSVSQRKHHSGSHTHTHATTQPPAPDIIPSLQATNSLIGKFLNAYPDIPQHNPKEMGQYIESHPELKSALENAKPRDPNMTREIDEASAQNLRDHAAIGDINESMNSIRAPWPGSNLGFPNRGDPSTPMDTRGLKYPNNHLPGGVI
ncbi:MAG: hypothetical protein M1812_001146 [Candelaria pacifica]|nr:MAG: hypothetical protein M1812_001146 [Candelaria pacifica]